MARRGGQDRDGREVASVLAGGENGPEYAAGSRDGENRDAATKKENPAAPQPGRVTTARQSPNAVAEHRGQWNCSSSVEPVSAFTLDEPPWITVVTSSK